jgi:hypothetical protein
MIFGPLSLSLFVALPSPMNAVLIATLGAEPQVISLATQCLGQQGELLVTVVVLHTHPTHPWPRHCPRSIRNHIVRG